MTKHSRINTVTDEHDSAPVLRERNEIKSNSSCWASANGSLKRLLLYSLLASVTLGAVLGVFLVLRNVWRWFEIQVILTTVVIAIASLCGLACDLSRIPCSKNYLPTFGLFLTSVSTVLILVGMWGGIYGDAYWKISISVSVFCFASVHVCLLSIVPLPATLQPTMFVAFQVIFGVASLLCVMIIWELDDKRMYRFVAVAAIVDAAVTLAIPLLSRISLSDHRKQRPASPIEQRNAFAIDQEIATLRERIEELERLRSKIGGYSGPLPTDLSRSIPDSEDAVQ